MTATELKKMPPEEKKELFYNTQRADSEPINSEKNSIDAVIEGYTNTEILLDDMRELKEELSDIMV